MSLFSSNEDITSFQYKVTKKPTGLAMVHQVREIKNFEEIWRYAQNTQNIFSGTTIFNKSYLTHAKSYDAAIVVLG